ncbi:MAG: hypothetical protein HRT44_12910 [Bdellovibrionales bacterium]|nr:hypothetical protein [Bdellovibrionales bacterium]NQZ20137.1 hypothetical protein [Bdellovibrionales bacterium]
MKFLCAIAIIFSNLSLQASEPCLNQAYDVVKELENFWAKEFGPIQGDYNKHQIDHKLGVKSEDTVSYTMFANHTNEDGETWYNEYTVVMNKDWCSVDSYQYHGSINTTPGPGGDMCIDTETAQDLLKKYLVGYIGEIPVDVVDWLDLDDDANIMTAEDVDSAVVSLAWDDYDEYFATGIVFSDYCAAGAECWGGFTVECDGEIGVWQDGED